MTHGLARGRVLEYAAHGLQAADLPPASEGRLDPRAWFDEPRQRFEIEIGSGKGTFLVQEAALHPATNYLGIEWTGEFYRYAADRLRRRGVANARILHADATEFLHHWCAAEVADVIHLYFSDPWPKTRHHKRRVVQDATMLDFHRVLRPSGEVRLVTDHDELRDWHLDHALRHEDLFERRVFQAPSSAGEGEIVGTNFERKYRREGRPFHAMTLVKRSRTSSLRERTG
jgi:tRNA (guanine-N7-)-methyltransferase